MDILTSVVRVSGITLIISGFKGVQQSLALKNYQFKKFFLSTLGGTLGSAVIGILLAIKGFGVWALVIQSLSLNLFTTLVFWITVKWYPKISFSFSRLKTLFGFGWKLLVSSLFEKIYNELRQLIIAKLYTTEDLAYYNKAHGWPHLFMSNTVGVIDRVLFPIMAAEQDDKKRVASMLSRSVKTSTYLITPFLVGLIACAEPLVRLVLTDKWIFCVPYMRIFCLGYIIYPICNANLNVYKAIGRSDLLLKCDLLSRICGILLLISTMSISVDAMVYSFALNFLITAIINSFPNSKLLSYGFLKQFMDILPTLILSAVMGSLVFAVQLFNLDMWVTLIIQIPLGVVVYLFGSVVLKIDSFAYFLSYLKQMLLKKA